MQILAMSVKLATEQVERQVLTLLLDQRQVFNAPATT